MKLLALILLAASACAQSVVQGTVVNAATGVPVAGAGVDFRLGGRSVAKTATDAQGAYRVDSLAPGQYTVIFQKEYFTTRRDRADAGAAPVRLDARLTPYATVSGRILGPGGRPVPKAAVLLFRVGYVEGHDQSAEPDGTFTFRNVAPGAYLLSARPPREFPAPEADRPRTWARTYYPGTEMPDAATRLTVAGGADLFGQDIVLRSIPARRLRGRVLHANGDPVPGAAVTVIPDGEWFVRDVQQETHTDEKGAFEFPSLYDGGWKVEVELAKPKMAADRRLQISADIDALDIHLNPSFELSGGIVLDPGVPVPHIGVILTPPGSGSHFYHAAIDNSGSFRFDAVTEGPYTVRMPGVAPPDYIASIRFGEREILGDAVEIVSGALRLTIRLKRDGGTVRGVVEDCAGGAMILAPQDPRLPPLDFVRRAACGPNGAFEIGAVRPGEYYAYAFSELPGPLEYGALVLAPLTNQAVRVTVRANEATQVALKPLPRP